MKKEENKEAMVVATLTARLHKKGTEIILVDKVTCGFIVTSFTKEDKKEMTKILKQQMVENIKKYHCKELEKHYSKVECRVSYRVTEVDYIIGGKD